MIIASNFKVIQGDTSKRIGDGAEKYEKTFKAENYNAEYSAILMLMVKGLTATAKGATVLVNNEDIGTIEPYTGGNPSHWGTQIINIGANVLKKGTNKLEIEAVPHPNPQPGNKYDDFYVRDVVCFYQVECRMQEEVEPLEPLI